MTAARPLVTVVLPTYNRVQYLQTAVASVLRQSYSAWELIVVNDGSTDSTSEYLAGLADSRVQVVDLAHCANPARLRNQAIALAAGQYVAFLDSDDLWMPEKLAIQVSRLTAHEIALWSYTNYKHINRAGETVADPNWWRDLSGSILEQLITHRHVATPTVMVKTDLLNEAGCFDDSLSFCEDYDLWFRLARRAHALAIPEQLTRVRLHAASLSRNSANQIGICCCAIRIYERMYRDADRRIEAICRRRAAQHMVKLARIYSSNGQPLQALAQLAKAFSRDPRLRAWWHELPRTLPRAALSRWRRSRL